MRGWRWGLGVVLLGGMACKDLTGSQPLPSGTPDPAAYATPAGALGMRNVAVAGFETALAKYVLDAGAFTDELEDAETGGNPALLPHQAVFNPLDERILPNPAPFTQDGSDDYVAMQGVRSNIQQALGALAAYDRGVYQQGNPAVLRGELYALEGYAELMLADLFCSGVPLSTFVFQGDYHYAASSTTPQVYRSALSHFDTAMTLATDSARILNLARLGKGRAWLALAGYDSTAYDSAAAAVAAIPDSFSYQLAVVLGGGGVPCFGCYGNSTNFHVYGQRDLTISNGEGTNGLAYFADPRTTVVANGFSKTYGVPLFYPSKYSGCLDNTLFCPMTLADWVEARLIRAEVDLHQHQYAAWLTELNTLRTSATVPGQTMAPLPLLNDPGTDTGRVSLLFQERAYWLFLTGHRQGDLRRLVRNYGRRQNQVYPTGPYRAPGLEIYGTAVTVPIPGSEYYNPNFHGCLDHNA